MDNLILASSSPRRSLLLKGAGLTFGVVKPDIPEIKKKSETPREYVLRLSLAKANAVSKKFPNPRLKSTFILSADTIVLDPKGIVMEKPKSHAHAYLMLKQLQGKTHTVLTGFCAQRVSGRKSKSILGAVRTKVTFRSMTKTQINHYLSLGESMDKAGAYAAQGAGMTIIKSIHGSFTNVVGLPVSEVLSALHKLGFQSW